MQCTGLSLEKWLQQYAKIDAYQLQSLFDFSAAAKVLTVHNTMLMSLGVSCEYCSWSCAFTI